MKALVRALPGALALAALVAAPTAAHAQLGWTLTFSPEAQGATGSGSGVITFNTTTKALFIRTTWTGLSGTTTVAHIHCCVTPPGTVGVAIGSFGGVAPNTIPGFPTGLSAGSYQRTIDLSNPGSFTNGFRNNNGGTAASATTALITAMNAGRAYFNIHTNTFPTGEIRAFTVVAPEPSTYALLAGGLSLVAAIGRRRRS
ncbi:MAG: CHRD domain-containing protein [Gemmatimonadales bacterium]|nr:CHRD domain-containing protein [Gemmatimonadales bacterium]